MANTTKRAYVIEPGDHLRLLAHRFAFDADDVWNDPQNAPLTKLGRTPNTLAPGDVLYIPEAATKWFPATPGTVNSFRATVPMMTIAVRLCCNDEPIANELCKPIDAQLDLAPVVSNNEGIIEIRVPVTTTQITMELSSLEIQLTLLVGQLDPATTSSGVTQRLSNLGFGRRDDEQGQGGASEPAALGQTRDHIADAMTPEENLRQFQRAANIPMTGVFCKQTQLALVERHGG